MFKQIYSVLVPALVFSVVHKVHGMEEINCLEEKRDYSYGGTMSSVYLSLSSSEEDFYIVETETGTESDQTSEIDSYIQKEFEIIYDEQDNLKVIKTAEKDKTQPNEAQNMVVSKMVASFTVLDDYQNASSVKKMLAVKEETDLSSQKWEEAKQSFDIKEITNQVTSLFIWTNATIWGSK